MISKEEYLKLTYKQQEKHLIRCYDCQLKYCPFDVVKQDNHYLCQYCIEERKE